MQLKKLSIIAASTLIVSGNIYAAAPTAYDNWVVEGGVVYSGQKTDGWMGGPTLPAAGPFPEAVQAGTPIYTAPGSTPTGGFSCDDPNITCKSLVQDEGFIYEQLTYTTASGVEKEYLRMIVVDQLDGNSENVSFSSESFVPFGIATVTVDQGVAVKQVVRDSADNFVDIAEIQKGMLRLDPDFVIVATGPGGGSTNGVVTDVDESFTARLNQTFSTPELSSSFGYTNYTKYETVPVPRNPDSGEILGQRVDLSQTVILGDNPNTTEPKKQVFEYRQANGFKGTFTPNPFGSGYRFGEALTAAGSMTVETYPLGGGDNGYDGSTVSYAATDDIRVTWIAATEMANFGDVSTPVGVGFAYQQVVNNTTDTSGRERYLGFIDGPTTDPLTIDPFDWDENNFGTPPVF